MRLVRQMLKWGGAFACLVLVLLFVYSTHRFIDWTSPSLEYGATVTLGAVNFAWRPESWDLEDDRYAGQAGWMVGGVVGGVSVWWVGQGAHRTWEWVQVPLWLPFLLLAVPTAFVWYRDRRGVRQALRRAIDWLRPVRRKRITFWRIAVFSAIHGVLAILGIIVAAHVYTFFSSSWQIGVRRPILVFIDGALACVLFGTPLWGILWAWLYVRVLNHLGQQSTLNRCFECGYDLTGNVSGRCPECGTGTNQAS